MRPKRRPTGFDQYLDQGGLAERRKAEQESAFEARTLTFLLTTFGMMPHAARELSRTCVQRTGESALRFTDFHAKYPDFPVILATKRLGSLHTDPRCFLPALFKRFDETPFWSAYEDHYEQYADRAKETGRAVGLVFPRKGIIRGLVIHNYEGDQTQRFQGTSLIYQAVTGKRTTRIYVQAFQAFVAALSARGHGWRP